jgi:hypothetical protein
MNTSLANRRLPHGQIAAGLAYWEKIRGGRAMPSRADFDPCAIAPILPFVFLVDVLREPMDFQFRLLGTEIDLIVERNYRGVRFSELAHMAAGNPVFDEYAAVVKSARPMQSQVAYVGSNRYVRRLKHALMPMSASGRDVDMIFGVVEIERRSVEDAALQQPAVASAAAD